MVLLGVAMGMTAAPLSTTMMNCVSSSRTGLAAGINSAVSRLSSVLGIAILGPLAIVSFGGALDSEAAGLGLPQETRVALAKQAAKLGQADVPDGLTLVAAETVQRAIHASFVTAFRTVSYACAAVVWIGALLAAFLIQGRACAS